MTMNQLIRRAATAYPAILEYWDEQHAYAVDNPGGGDGLAEFIAWEIYETFDPDADDDTQIMTAVGAMQRAIDCLKDVSQALRRFPVEQRLAA
jgi:hypothetical protein